MIIGESRKSGCMDSDDVYRSVEQTSKTIEAAKVLRANAVVIAQACALVGRNDVVLAIVSPQMLFVEPQMTPLSELHTAVELLEPFSWHLVFSPGVDMVEIERRCADMEELATLKLDVLKRRERRQAERETGTREE